jgi:hypothetical protein
MDAIIVGPRDPTLNISRAAVSGIVVLLNIAREVVNGTVSAWRDVRQRWTFVAMDFERHGWRDKAYRDVFTACLAQRTSTSAAYCVSGGTTRRTIGTNDPQEVR